MIKTILTILILGSIIILGIYYPIVWWIIGIGLIIVIALIYLFICISDKSSESSMKEKFGENYKELIQTGKLGLRIACPCKPDIRYTSKKEIEKLSNISLPDFVIKECKETLGDITGDYSGEATIEFCTIIDDSIIRQINDDMSKGDSRWRKSDNNDEYICGLIEPDLSSTPSKDEYWRLILRRDSNMGQIAYGRI
mgnify:CR=1 FL=1|jgi:hypothetical protein